MSEYAKLSAVINRENRLNRMVWKLVWICLLVISFIAIMLCVPKSEINFGYNFFILIPLTFFILSIVFMDIYKLVPKNIGVTLILVLMFIRMIISPVCSFVSYFATDTISLNIDKNSLPAIMLVCYEAVAVFACLNICYENSLIKKLRIKKIQRRCSKRGASVYITLLLFLVAVLLVCILITPRLVYGYRTIFQVLKDTNLTYSSENIILSYESKSLKRIAIVLGLYLIRLLIVPAPAVVIILLSKHKKRKINRFISLIVCMIPALVIGDALADGILNCFILLIIRAAVFKRSNLSVFISLFVAGLAVIAFWIWRYASVGLGMDVVAFFANRFSEYCSGVNIVSGSFNIPQDLGLKCKIFINDILFTIPFNLTLFPFEHNAMPTYFNLYNDVRGQIPTNVGSGYYYFGPVLAPIYSVILAIVTFRCGRNLNTNQNPYSKILYAMMVTRFSLGIIMYNYIISLDFLFNIVIPLLVVERIAFGAPKKARSSKRRKKCRDYRLYSNI